VFYILHGDDEFSRAEAVAQLRANLAEKDPAMAELNTAFLDGRQVAMGELRHACDTIPFMADKRLVIVQGLLGRLAASRRAKKGTTSAPEEEPAWKPAFVAELGEYLPRLPEKTRLIFVETRTLPSGNPILKLGRTEEVTGKAFVKAFELPKQRDLPAWIRRRTRDKGGQISHEAVNMLAALVGRDLRLLDLEIDKLLTYTDGQQVTAADVRALVSRAREISIFDLVDAIGLRQTDRALRLLHAMLADLAAPLYLLSMIARQIRILLQVSELLAQGLGESDIASQLKLHPYVTKKGVAQAHNFSRGQLKDAHNRLVETDWSIKTGKIHDELALDLLVVDLSQSQQQRSGSS
jgi:DNA polymerase-3 subunit delta